MFSLVKKIFARHRVVPFESLFAILFILASLLKFISWDTGSKQLESLVGFKAAVVFNAAFLVAGTTMLTGIGWRKNVEAFGLITVVSSILIQLVILTAHSGFTVAVVVGLVFWGLFISGCLVRLNSVLRNNIIVEVKGGS